MQRIPERSRLPVLVGVSLLVLLLVAGAVIVAPRLVPVMPTPSPSSDIPGSPSPEALTPEAAVRAFFEAVAVAREAGDAAAVEPLTTGTDSSAYRTIDAFVRGQREVGKASVLTRNELVDLVGEESGDEAVVTLTHRVEGFDIDLDSGQPLESPTALPDRLTRVELKLLDGRWLVDRFEVLS